MQFETSPLQLLAIGSILNGLPNASAAKVRFDDRRLSAISIHACEKVETSVAWAHTVWADIELQIMESLQTIAVLAGLEAE